jgi:hypothetical protein
MNDPQFRRWSGITLLALLLTLGGRAAAAEVVTNGTGGGLWTDKATWKGGTVPGREDEVTIRKGDAVVFDRDDGGPPLPDRAAMELSHLFLASLAPGQQCIAAGPTPQLLRTAARVVLAHQCKTTCAKLFIDPDGALRFKTGIGRVVFVVGGPVESFGLVKLDGSVSADDFHELRFIGKTTKDREAKFEKGTLILSGRPRLPGGRRNVLISSWSPEPKGPEPWVTLDVKQGTIDVQHAELFEVKLQGNEIDNTGAKVGQRCNIVGNRFFGRAMISLISCDTPIIAENSFHYPDAPWYIAAAIYLSGCPLAEVKNNTITGYFYYGISVYVCTDAVVADNTIEKTSTGIYCVGTARYKGNTFREVAGGFVVTSMKGTIDDCTFEKCGYAIHLSTATVQMANCVYHDPPKDGHAIDFLAGEATLINCNFGPESISLPKMLPKSEVPLVTAMELFILKVNGEVPEDTLVDVRTTKPDPPLAPGVADLNVRNAPAPIVGKTTPLPQSLSPIILRSWMIDKDGKKVPAPEYTVRVLAPAEGDKERKVLKVLTVKPEAKWFRPKPNDPAPTLEVNLK